MCHKIRWSIFRPLVLTGSFILLLFPLSSKISSAQVAAEEEVLLSFRFNSIGNVYVTGHYENNIMYLPISELFNLLFIPCEKSESGFSLVGSFLDPAVKYEIDLNSQFVKLGSKTYTLAKEDYRYGDLDFFLSPGKFEEIFQMKFAINFNTLTLSLESPNKMPVEQREEREKARKQLELRQEKKDYPPAGFERKRAILRPGVLDYTLAANYQENAVQLNLDLNLGMELLGGDLQGNVYALSGGSESFIGSNNLRWRYAVTENEWLSSVAAGYLTSTGLYNRQVIGAGVTNDPIEPRRLYDSYIIDGTTDAESEVELYVNGRMVDYQRADQTGYYRFNFPLTFGTTRVSINIYTPAGEVKTIDRQIQIPYTFLPKGVLAYHVMGGYTDTFGETDYVKAPTANADVAYGITNWLTAKVGSEYLKEDYGAIPLTYGSVSARLFKQYLINLDIAPAALYRVTGSVIYPSDYSFSLNYSRYTGPSIFNTRGAIDEVVGSAYLPMEIFGFNLGLRLNADYYRLESSSVTRYRADLNFRLGRVNMNFNYQDNLLLVNQSARLGQGVANSIVTYSFARTSKVPAVFRGLFIRAHAGYSMYYSNFESIDLQLSKSIFKTGYITISGGYEPVAKSWTGQFGLNLNFEQIRTATKAEYRQNNLVLYQSLRGSLGYDYRSHRFSATNTEQVGRASASVLLFIDNNNNGICDQGDERMPYKAIRLDQSATIQIGRDSVIRISQLQAYYRYNIEVNRSALPNPLIAPAIDKFSFVADPNQYKRIEIPFYRTGVAEGIVYLQQYETKTGIGGLRLLLKKEGSDVTQIVKTFSAGDFYVMDLSPGRYTLEVDPAQLGFMNAYYPAQVLRFEIKALAEGDFVEGIEIVLFKNGNR